MKASRPKSPIRSVQVAGSGTSAFSATLSSSMNGGAPGAVPRARNDSISLALVAVKAMVAVFQPLNALSAIVNGVVLAVALPKPTSQKLS